MLQQDPIVEAIKGVDTPLTAVTGGMFKRTFHRDDISTDLRLLNAKYANMRELE
jgi:predicted phage gp36 major capsid-like protein